MATETRHGTFTPVLRGLRADRLDCVQTSVAVLADRHGGADAHLAIGAAQSLIPDSSVPNRLAEAETLAGVVMTERVEGAPLREAIREHAALFVVADAYRLPWTSYAGHQHMDHSFLLLAGSSGPVVVDAYHNDTQWGADRPGVWKLGDGELAALPDATAFVPDVLPVKLDAAAVLATNAAAMAAAAPTIDDYVTTRVADLPRLVLDVWLIGRSRLLHAAWLAATGLPADDAARQAGDWLAFAGQTYVAMRRAERGTVPVAALAEQLNFLLRGDIRLAVDLVDGLVRDAVTEALCAVLRVPMAEVRDDRPLRELPNYNSFRLVDVINRVEDRLCRQVDPVALTAGNLRDAAGLCALFLPKEA